jgi:ribonuclease HIII
MPSSDADTRETGESLTESNTARMGTDEAGKGDFFGPLVIAAVWADEATISLFKALGVADSKKLSNGRAHTLARQIMEGQVPHAVVAIGPEKYNQLYAKIKNLNRLLAWGHARAIENLLEKAPASHVLIDQFAAPHLIENALLEKGKQIQVEQRHRGESDVVVAAASIIARSQFLRGLDALSEKCGVKLHKGAGAPVDQVAARILARGGRDLLATVAKVHFKNTQKAERLRPA